MIRRKDGGLGQGISLHFDDRSWIMRYLVVGVSPWFTGQQVLLPQNILDRPNRTQRVVPVDPTKEQARNSPGMWMHPLLSRQEARTLSRRTLVDADCGDRIQRSVQCAAFYCSSGSAADSSKSHDDGNRRSSSVYHLLDAQV